MKASLLSVTALVALAGASPALAASIFYNGGSPLAGGGGTIGSATYTIETDGTLGALSSTNLLSFTLTLNPTGMSAMTFTGRPMVSGSALSATATSLAFDFGQSSATLGLQSGTSYLYFLGGSNPLISAQSPSGSGTFRPGTNIIGTASPMPEPATWAMMIGGFGMVGASLRRRRLSLHLA